MVIGILKETDLTIDAQEEISQLFTQLSPEKKQITLNKILNSGNPVTFVYCKEGSKIIGIALMAEYTVISGNKGWIEDVVVDKNYRRKGIGRKLMEKLINEGKAKNLTEILLFTENEKKPAINLYRSLGFNVEESRIYNLKIS